MTVSAARLLDEYLLSSAKLGDRKAWQQLARRWHPKLVAHAWRLTGDMAHDAAQSAWRLPAATLLILSAQMKFLMWPSLQANRIIREVKRLELQVVRARP